jgi:zinc transporter 1/2/3
MFFAEVAAYRIGTRRLLKLGMVYSTHDGDATDAHAHSHSHDPPLAVNTSGPALQGHVHPEAMGAVERDLGAEEAEIATLTSTSTSSSRRRATRRA